MDKNESKSSPTGSDEPATLPGAASYEEGLKDYRKTNEDAAINNLPDLNPEPSPTENTNTYT